MTRMDTYRQFLEARHLSEVLLMKHAEEGAKGKPVLYRNIQVEESFAKLASQLGFIVQRLPSSVKGEAA